MKYECKIRTDQETTMRLVSDDQYFKTKEDAILYYRDLFPSNPIEIWIGESLVWRSESAAAMLNKNQFELFRR